MSRKDTILKAAKRTAREAREAATRRSPNIRRANISDMHRHCVVCWKPIPLDAEPPICEKEACFETHGKREKSRKRLTFMLYLFPAIALSLVLLQLVR